MSNSKGNQYPLWYISNEFGVYAVDKSGSAHSKSKTNFAMDIGVSEDGTVWVLSNEPDPDGGGAKIYWSNGDGSWNEINTSDPGGIKISGAANSRCIYLTSEGDIYTLNTDGTTTKDYSNSGFMMITYGGNYIWAVVPEKEGGIPVLRYTSVTDPTKTWTTFGNGVHPTSISSNYQGTCFAVLNFNPVYYTVDGQSGSAGAGADGTTMQISFRNWNFILTTDATSDGNQIMEWQDTNGGTYMAITPRGSRVESSYYRAS